MVCCPARRRSLRVFFSGDSECFRADLFDIFEAESDESAERLRLAAALFAGYLLNFGVQLVAHPESNEV